MNLVWFKNDLRAYDNPALSASMCSGPTLAIYCLVRDQWDQHGDAIAKRSLIINQLRDLHETLANLNVPLIVLDCGDYQGLEENLLAFIQTHEIMHLYLNHDYALNESRCNENVCLNARVLGIESSVFHDQCLMVPGTVRTLQNEPFKNFTAFKRRFVALYSEQSRSILGLPRAQESTGINSDLRALNLVESSRQWDAFWPAGEDQAHDRLNHFVENTLSDYHSKRDIPGIDGTSGLSPYLAIGAISTVQCLRAALCANEGSLTEGRPGVVAWMNELIWREFYRHLLVSNPDLSRGMAFKSMTEHLPWRKDESAFEAWKQGRTGFPIVDAAMRQLKEQAWMHNRLRMVVAMFLTKDLFIDWRWGERYFMEHLIDGDFASNNGGWQWAASTGVDAAPYFRIFNPTRQSERFDPDGSFIRRFVPELSLLDGKSIHCPTTEQRMECKYPLPLVNHAEATRDTKFLFKSLAETNPSREPCHV